jgi:HK97 gp10 family phage protein
MAFDTSGTEGLMAALRSLPDAMGRTVMRQAIEKALRPMQAQLLANTPVGPTGNLRNAVATRVTVYGSGVGFGVVGYKPPVSQSTSDAKGSHSRFVEFGTKDRVPSRRPFLSSYGIAGRTPRGWNGPWPMVARRVRGARSLHPLGHAYDATNGQCLGILVTELAAGLERSVSAAKRGT